MENKPASKGSFFKKFLGVFFLVIVLVIVVLFFIFSINYSNGARAGVLIKVSQKGLILKTYEGELNIGGMNTIPGTAQANQIWNFSIKDRAVAEQLMQLTGQRVSLHYHEIMKAMPWQGETNYFVDSVTTVNQ